MKHEKIKTSCALRSSLAAMIGGAAVAVKADPHRLFRAPGEASANEAILVLEGIMALYRCDPAGRRHIVGIRFPGESIIPYGASFDYGIQALVRSQCSVVADFSDMTLNGPDLIAALWRTAQRNEGIALEWLAMRGREAAARVAFLLCETAIRGGFGRAQMRLPFTQQQIGDIVGLTSVHVNRMLADFEREGMIERDKRALIFMRWDELARLGSFREAYLEVDFAGHSPDAARRQARERG